MCDVIAGTTLQLQRAETRVPSARAVLLASRRAAYRSWFRESRPRSHSTAVSVPYLGWGLIRNPQVSKKAISSVWHRVRPFHRPRMVPGSVSIS